MRTLFLSIAAAVLFAATSYAHDLLPPSWRGVEGSTYQEWTFDDDDNPAYPEVDFNEFGDPEAYITVGNQGTGWQDQIPGLGTQTGIWDLGGEGGEIVIDIPNSDVDNPYKLIWVQVTYWSQPSAAPIIDVPGATFLEEFGQTGVLVEQDPVLGSWVMDLSVWRIEPNPIEETVIISSNWEAGTIIDQVVIDTACIPEPGTVMIMLGGVALLVRRIRKNS